MNCVAFYTSNSVTGLFSTCWHLAIQRKFILDVAERESANEHYNLLTARNSTWFRSVLCPRSLCIGVRLKLTYAVTLIFLLQTIQNAVRILDTIHVDALVFNNFELQRNWKEFSNDMWSMLHHSRPLGKCIFYNRYKTRSGRDCLETI